MRARIGQIVRAWRSGAGGVDRPRHQRDGASGVPGPADGLAADGESLALPEPAHPVAPPPEQPVLLTSSGEARPVRVGEVLPARRRPWPLDMVRLPVVPKRAILAAGVCVGLVGPGLARHLATRILLGPPAAAAAGGVLEITRITYTGPLTPKAAAAISKALIAARR